MTNSRTAVGDSSVFDKKISDIPSEKKCLKTVRNRPYLFACLGLVALVIFFILAPQYRIGLAAAIIGYAAIIMLINNRPVVSCYDGFIVAYDPNDSQRIAIIMDDELQAWRTESTTTACVVFSIRRKADPENKQYVAVPTINTFGVENVLNDRYDEKSFVTMQQKKMQEKNRRINADLKRRLLSRFKKKK